MPDPVVVAVANVGVALTKVLLRACDNSLGADLVGDGQEIVGILSRALRRTDESKGQIELRVSQALATRTKAMRERCSSQGVDPDLLSGACTEVEIILEEIADDGALLLSAVRTPESFPETLREYAARRRMNVEAAAEPYFDELVQAVAAEYSALAPWSPRFQIEAFKSILSGIDEIQENSRLSLDAHAVTHDKLDTLSSKLAEVAHHENKPSRVFFGSRPDVVTGDRYIERDEQKHLNVLIVDPTEQRTVLVGMRGCGKTQLAASLAKQCEDANWNLVAWINAVSPDTIQSDLVELAKRLKIDTSDQPAQDVIVRRCLDHLKSAAPTDRLIVFDNVEDINHLRGLMPNGNGLRVIATTTNNSGWEYQDWTIIKVGVFDRDKSIKHLLDVTDSEDHDAADALAERLGDLPIAVTQASGTCKRLEISLNYFNTLLNDLPIEEALDPTSSSKDQEGIISTFITSYNLTFEQMKKLEKGEQIAHIATCILQALCYLSDSGIPTRWLKDDGDLYSLKAYALLVDSSLIQQSHDKAITRIHRLCFYAFRKLFSRNNEEVTALQTAANCLQYGAGLAYDETEPTKQVSMVKDFNRQLLSCIIQDHSKGILSSKGVHEAMNAMLAIQIPHREEFSDLQDIAEKAIQELLLNWDWNDPAHHYELE